MAPLRRLLLLLVLISFVNLFTDSTKQADHTQASGHGKTQERKTTTRVENRDYSLLKNRAGGKRVRSSVKNSECTHDTNYDPCIDPSNIEGYCSCDTDTKTITVYRGAETSNHDDYYLRYCLDRFAAFGYFRYYALQVVNLTNLALEGDILGGMKFDEVIFDGSKITSVDSIFLAGSRSFTSVLSMDSIVADKVPLIEASCLHTLHLKFDATEQLKIRDVNLRHLTELQTLRVFSNTVIRVSRNAFRNLPSLEHLMLGNSVSLPYGSLSFEPSNKVQKIEIVYLVQISPGAINNLMDVDLWIAENQVGWSPAVWFNFLRLGGGTLSSMSGPSCSDCQHAWLRRGFMPAAAGVKCANFAGPPSEIGSFPLDSYSHC